MYPAGDEKQTVREKDAFGFTENIYSHIHPPYHRGDEGHALVVMSRPIPISQDQYDNFNVYLWDKIMKDAFA